MNKIDFCLNFKKLSLEIFTQNNVEVTLKTSLKIPEYLLIILKRTWNFGSAKKRDPGPYLLLTMFGSTRPDWKEQIPLHQNH